MGSRQRFIVLNDIIHLKQFDVLLGRQREDSASVIENYPASI